MKKAFIFPVLAVALLFSGCGIFEQLPTPGDEGSFELSTVTDLNNTLDETSALVKIEGKFFTLNDSGEAALYEIDTATGNIARTVAVHNALNVDWEAMTADETHVYIADVGNNSGDRDDLKIYKVPKNALLTNASVDAEVIHLSYADQTVFEYDERTTPYDAEALIAFDGMLYIFTKNWADYTTNVYSVPTAPGSHSVIPLDYNEKKLDVMVTDAAYDAASDSVALVGYTNPYDSSVSFKSMVFILKNFDGNSFFSGDINAYTVTDSLFRGQIESVAFNSSKELYLTSESTSKPISLSAKLYKAMIAQ